VLTALLAEKCTFREILADDKLTKVFAADQQTAIARHRQGM
jgi:hypothetical protein